MRETDYRRALSRQRKGTRSWLHGGQTDQCIRWDGVLQGYRAGTRVASCDLVGKHSEPLESASDHRGKNRQRGTDRAPSQSREDVGLGCLEGDPDGRRGHDETGGSRPGGNGHRFGDAGKSWGRTEQADRHHFVVFESANLRSAVSLFSAGCKLRYRASFPGRFRFRAESSVQDTDWTELFISGGKELCAAGRARAWFLIHGSPLCSPLAYRFSGLSFHGSSRPS